MAEEGTVQTGRIVIVRVESPNGDVAVGVHEAYGPDGNPLPVADALLMLRLADEWFMHGPRA